jgi:hypothetical protein
MIRAFQWDLARQVERLDVLKKLLPRYAAWGYEELYLHLEDAVHFPSLPGIGRTDAFTHEELGELVASATQHGIRVVPIINLLGHTQYLIKHPELRDLNELRDANGVALERGQVCPLHPQLLPVAEKLLRDVVPFCTAGKVHVGLDESFHLGKCPRCRDEVDRIGLGGHFAGHVNRLHAVTQTLGLQMGIWADMLYFVPEAIKQLPRGIIAYDWYYYPFGQTPRVEFFNFAERDLAPALRKQGIQYYGCPMNGAFRYEPLPVYGDRLGNIRSWWERCQRVNADGFLVTSWEAYRLALETTTVVDAAAASLWLKPTADDHTSLLADGLQRHFAIKSPRPLARLLLAADEHAFAGYARWQINDRWDMFAGHEGLKTYEHDRDFYTRALRTTMPAVLSDSLKFRLYLAERDVFVRQAARDVFKLRRLARKPSSDLFSAKLAEMKRTAHTFEIALKLGRLAAKAMWRHSRKTDWTNQNETILKLDQQRLATWKRWLVAVAKKPERTFSATPVCGVWQLQFVVHNFAPACQRVAVEQQDGVGHWHELAGRHTIEFRAAAARPSSKIKREFTVPIDDPGLPLRLVAQGVGQVQVSHLALTNGVTTRRADDFRTKKTLGRPAPHRGFPDITKRVDHPISFSD